MASYRRQCTNTLTTPIAGQKTGTSGLRRKSTLVLETPHFVDNWVQSLVNALGTDTVKNSTFILGGDGRFFNDVAARIIIKILAGNGAAKVIVGQHGLMSTPAVSNFIRRMNGGDKREVLGGLILTASHNPAGPSGDWGIKFNAGNGEPALESLTNLIYEESQRISELHQIEFPDGFLDFSNVGVREDAGFILEVVDSCTAYIDMLKSIFDFPDLSRFCADHRVLFDGMHAVTGAYAHAIFCKELGLDESCLFNCTPKPDFGGGHPDPNLIYAAGLVESMRNSPDFALGAASDGDGDRNMIVGGGGFFVSPSDSLAIIASFATRAIHYFKVHGLKGVARSMPTSQAVDLVASSENVKCYQTPTGWKFFGNLMDAGRANLCGEESFGTGADHIREKDGIWAVLCWLSILAYVNRDKASFVSVKDICEQHWDKFGRHFYRRCDYEECELVHAEHVFEELRRNVAHWPETESGWELSKAEEYTYTDPVDGSVARKQGIVFSFENGSRVIFRLSGTGSAGATIRVYLERYCREWRTESEELEKGKLMEFALKWSKLEQITARKAPNVVT